MSKQLVEEIQEAVRRAFYSTATTDQKQYEIKRIADKYHGEPGFVTAMVGCGEPERTWLIQASLGYELQADLCARPGTGRHILHIPHARMVKKYEIGDKPITLSWKWVQFAIVNGCSCKEKTQHMEAVLHKRYKGEFAAHDPDVLERHQNPFVEATPEVMAEWEALKDKQPAEDETDPGKPAAKEAQKRGGRGGRQRATA
jgi:hypothetical protein